MVKMKETLENNQYPSTFYEPIIHATLEKIFLKTKKDKNMSHELNLNRKKLFFIQYRGVATENM